MSDEKWTLNEKLAAVFWLIVGPFLIVGWLGFFLGWWDTHP